MKKRGYVYLLYDQSKERVYKIGVTTGSLERRIKKLQTGNSGKITVSRFYETDYPFFIEKHLHRKFGAECVLNEWFNLSDEDAGKFKQYCEEIEKIVEVMKDNPFFPKSIK